VGSALGRAGEGVKRYWTLKIEIHRRWAFAQYGTDETARTVMSTAFNVTKGWFKRLTRSGVMQAAEVEHAAVVVCCPGGVRGGNPCPG
jgi:hypothetical protein